MATGGAYVLTRGSAPKRPPSGGAGLPSAGSAAAPAGQTPITHKPMTFGQKPPPPARPGKPPARRPGKPAAPVDPLAPLTPQQIRQQATKTIQSAYSGALTDVNQQRQQAQNLYKTQATDDAAFQQWLTSSAQSLQSQTDTVNQKLADVLTGMRTTQTQQLNAVPGQLAASEAQPGGSTSPADLQKGLTGLTSPYINAAEAHANVAGIEQAETAMGGNNLLAGSAQAAAGSLDQLKGQQAASLDKTMQSIASERTKLITARTGDIAKEIARLNGIEISKAQFKANQANLQQELGLKQQGVAIQKENADVGALKAQEEARHNAAVEQINSAHYASQAAHDAAVAKETARHNAVSEAIGQQNANTNASKAAAAGAPGAAKPGTPQQQAAIRSKIGEVRQMLIWDINTYHKGDPAALSKAWHDLENGNFMAARYGHRDTSGKWIPGPRVPVNQDVGIINAAANTLTQYGAQGLTQGDIAWLQNQGLSNINGYYPVKGAASKASNGGPGNRG